MAGEKAQQESDARRLMMYWPVALAVAATIMTTARADTKINAQEARIETLEMTRVEILERLARVEQTTLDTKATTQRIELKLDRLPR